MILASTVVIAHGYNHAEQALRFQGVSASVNAPGSAPTVDPSTQVAGLPFKQKLNIGEKTPLSPAMQACLSLVAVYYAMYLVGWLANLRADLTAVMKGEKAAGGDGAPETLMPADGKQDPMAQMEAMMRQMAESAKSTMLLIPMLTILIVFARLRAKVDLEGTNPPDYARKAFFGATAIIYVQAFQSFVISMLKNCMPGSAKGLVIFQNVLTFCCTIGVYGCIVAIFYSICTLTKTASE